MKKNYVSPTAEKVEFNYSEQVVAASGGTVCEYVTAFEQGADGKCTNMQQYLDSQVGA